MLKLAVSFFALFYGNAVYANVDLPGGHNTVSVTKTKRKKKKVVVAVCMTALRL